MTRQDACHYEAMKVAELRPEDWAAWEDILRSREDLSSPFFHPGFTQAVANSRRDIDVVILRNGSAAVGFFPFQRGRGNTACAVAGRIHEFQGVIVRPEVSWDPAELLRSAGLRAWHFDHLPVSQTPLEPYLWRKEESVFMDLSEGYETYRATVKERGSSLSQVERKGRKLAREVGPLRFEFHSTHESAFQSFLDWKTAQHNRSGYISVLHVDWINTLLNQLRTLPPEHDFGGQFSTLYAGDRLVAVHMGLRSRAALHIWFPTYNMEFEKYSPGLILLLEMAQAAAQGGLQRVDFGRTGERYKANFKTGSVCTAEGAVDLRPVFGPLRRRWFGTKQWIRSSPYRDFLEKPLIASRKLRQRMALR